MHIAVNWIEFLPAHQHRFHAQKLLMHVNRQLFTQSGGLESCGGTNKQLILEIVS